MQSQRRICLAVVLLQQDTGNPQFQQIPDHISGPHRKQLIGIPQQHCTAVLVHFSEDI